MPDGIDNDKLKAMMESYREQIQLNTKLLERQERFIDSLDGSTKRLIEAINSQTASLNSVLSQGLVSLSEKITRDHSGITLRIYVALGGMISILITLISIWMTK
jgi:hypothetical protein